MKNNYNYDDFIIFSSSCTLTKGKNRTLIADYLRNELYFITNEYYELLEKIDRKTINEIFKLVDKSSINSFFDFINFLVENEIIFFSENLNQFPKRKVVDETHEIIKDAIIEIDMEYFNEELFKKNILELNLLKCNDLQLRILSYISFEQLKNILNIVNLTSINYTEIHLNYSKELTRKKIFTLIEKYAIVSHVYIYGSPKNDILEFNIKKDNYYQLLLGNIYYIKDDFNDGDCCGNISLNTLSFENINTHFLLKKTNGCLYKKITIDRKGLIKNCPSIKNNFGNSNVINLIDVVSTNEFNALGLINKDNIEICKECEFRYNCTDCRAFLEEPNNILSKPLKCGYNLDTFEWEDWSNNTLKNTGKFYENN
jgi:SPASM domain peptide maturase of grasp-with-spasm system